MTPFAPIIFSLQKLGYLKFRRVVASLQSNKAWNLDFVVIVQSGNKSNKLINRVTVIVFVQKTSEQNKFKKKEIKNENSSLTRISPYRMCEQIANRLQTTSLSANLRRIRIIMKERRHRREHRVLRCAVVLHNTNTYNIIFTDYWLLVNYSL